MEAESEVNYEAEQRQVHRNNTSNLNTVQRFLASVETDVTATCRKLETKILNALEERKKTKQKTQELREAIRQAKETHTRNKDGVQQLERELEKLNMVLQGKEEELDAQKKALAECVENVKKEESLVSEVKLENQRKTSQADTSIQLFKKHLGLDIACLHNTLVFKFTQVSHSNPDAEYMVHLSLEEDKYTLLGSEPPLPSLPQLQEELNASGNLLACIVQIRKLFERMDSKRRRQ
ncbi:myosin-1B-like isoform X2 [Scylla paramamosain]|uniref:myosin-1B-like isoform X2 n=1 Tax=Scylla paramamosain TaxID=85552 RepID=UPI0030838494